MEVLVQRACTSASKVGAHCTEYKNEQVQWEATPEPPHRGDPKGRQIALLILYKALVGGKKSNNKRSFKNKHPKL